MSPGLPDEPYGSSRPDPVGLPGASRSQPQPVSGKPAGKAGAGWVRPYQLTGGRTAPVDPSLALEAQVVASPQTLQTAHLLTLEYRDLVHAARGPVSIAELGAHLRLHLQVVRVLVADLAADGHLRVIRPIADPARDPDVIERVIRGLSNIA